MPTDVQLVEPGEGLGSTKTIYGVLAAATATDPARPFLRDGGKTITYGELLTSADRAAARMAGLGIAAGERVVLWLPNGMYWATLFFACARLGSVAVMAGTRLRALDIRHLLADSEAVALAFTPRFLGIDYEPMVHELREDAGLPQLRHLLAGERSAVPEAVMLDRMRPAAVPPAFDNGGAPALVCYTSGTTGRPKGCVHSHAALVSNAAIASKLTGLNADDRIACPVPFAHVFGFHMAVLQGALCGATVLNAEPYRPDRLLDLVEEERATVLYAVPAMAREALAGQAECHRDLTTLRTTVIAGAPASSELRRAVVDPVDGLGSTLTVVYGCTEGPTLTQLVPADPPLAQVASVGRPTPGVKLRVCQAGTENPVPVGEIGEILACGYNQMLGYLGDVEGTSAKRRGEWLVTGDLGWLDENGFLYIAGRTSEMFLVGGFNVYPREVEAQLEQMPGVIEAAVVGVPDERLGSVPMAWVTVSSPRLGERHILAWARRQLASYRRPRQARIVASLPHTSSGKLARVKLEQLARRALPGLDWEGER